VVAQSVDWLLSPAAFCGSRTVVGPPTPPPPPERQGSASYETQPGSSSTYILSLLVPHTAHFHMEAILMDQSQQPNPHATKISLKLMIHKIQSMKPTINLPNSARFSSLLLAKRLLPVLALLQITKILLEENINPHHLHLQV